MPRCNCSRCCSRSSSKSSSRRDDKDAYKCDKKSREKPRSCNCNKCKYRISPKCRCYDSDNDENDDKPCCSSNSHQFIITVKTNN